MKILFCFLKNLKKKKILQKKIFKKINEKNKINK